jgi:hypothetical protein
VTRLYIFLRMNATAMHYLSHGSFCQKKSQWHMSLEARAE